ncbi:hypothetical protein ACFY8C_31400 [Streptomyces flavochromogenes]|uniref:Bacterial transcriptional activator domain-containing protein n=1 Tax=Streptomyces flavochromogenes TaxID=68199 RepID=A0ABW6XZJ5_9ACTN|nr:bacterial transcriptional activator domain-containing protein [Streptomyces flavochromogenes]
MTKHAEGHRLVGVECDWIQFQLLHDIALQVPRDQVQGLLRRALELVHGRPFSGVSPTYYSWAEPIVEDINDKVVNTSSLLANWYLEDGDGPGALWAASRGLEAAREREELWRHRFHALALLGDHTGLEEAIQRLETLLTDHGWAMEEKTPKPFTCCKTPAPNPPPKGGGTPKPGSHPPVPDQIPAPQRGLQATAITPAITHSPGAQAPHQRSVDASGPGDHPRITDNRGK